MGSGERRRPVLAAFVGYPGSGKTTQASAIAAAVGVPRLRLGRFLKDQGILKTPEEMDNPLQWYERLLEYTDYYLKQAVQPCLESNGWAVLDGFPRSLKETEALLAFSQQHDCALTLIHFDLPDQAERERFSLERQRSRAVTLGRALNDHWYWGKINLAKNHELTCMERARELKARIISIDPRWPLQSVTRRVREALRLDMERLPWDWENLELLQRIAPTSYLIDESFYRPFFNGIYGPAQHPWHLRVAVDSDAYAAELQALLEREASHVRWRVGNALRFMREKTGMPITDLTQALQLSHHLIGLSGGVRLSGEKSLEVVFGPEAEAHLRRGVLQSSALGNLLEAKRKARQLTRDYPGLSAPFIGHEPRQVIPDWLTIHEATKALEHGGRRQWSGLSQAELDIAQELHEFVLQADKKPIPPPVPKHVACKLSADPLNLMDAEFAEWLVTYAVSDEHLGVIDPSILHALTNVQDVAQKPTHQGWMTDQHALSTLLQLQTDHVPVEFRRSLRLAALYHDHGKKRDMTTPGAHAAIGARLWKEHYVHEWPHLLDAQEQRLVPFLIAQHDLLGRLARGVKDLDYAGGIDPSRCREILRSIDLPLGLTLDLVLALNRADIGSVAALRWTLPELDFAARMILSVSYH